MLFQEVVKQQAKYTSSAAAAKQQNRHAMQQNGHAMQNGNGLQNGHHVMQPSNAHEHSAAVAVAAGVPAPNTMTPSNLLVASPPQVRDAFFLLWTECVYVPVCMCACPHHATPHFLLAHRRNAVNSLMCVLETHQRTPFTHTGRHKLVLTRPD